jgi:hypothetical protein
MSADVHTITELTFHAANSDLSFDECRHANASKPLKA